MKIILPIAGIGKRLRPHTHTRHKALVPVAGKPMIDHLMDKLIPLEPTELVFIVGYQRHQLEKYLREKYHMLQLRFVHQEVPLGTAHAVQLGLDGSDEDVLVVFGDTLFETDLMVVKDCKDDGITWAQPREDYQRFGIIITDTHGYMKHIVEKPQEPIGKLANIGLHWFGNMPLLREAIEHTMITKKPNREAYLTDTIQYMIEKGARIKTLTATGWFDCGTAEALLEANQVLLDKMQSTAVIPGCTIIPPVAIDPSADVQNSTIGPHVSVGPHVIIHASVISNSIIDTRAEIRNARLTDSIIGEEAVIKNQSLKAIIGDHSRIE